MDRFARLVPLLAFVLAAPAGAAPPEAAPVAPHMITLESTEPAAAIADAKVAMGGPAWDKVVTWHETGSVVAGGLNGTYENWEDLTDLHNSGSYLLGPATGGAGWDGKAAWTTDSSKEVRIETSAEATAQAIQDAYRGAYGFFFPDRFPAELANAGAKEADGKSYDVVKVTPKGAEPFEVWFDPASHLVAREVQLTGAQPHTFLYSDFAQIDGLTVPKKTIDRVGNDPKYDTVITVGALAFGAAEPASRYAPPPPPANSAAWPQGKDAVTVPFRLLNNHIYVEASLNGEKPRDFVFDTGATAFLDNDAAKAMGIKVEGALPGSGFGDQINPVGLTRVKSVALGGLTLPDQVFATSDTKGWIRIEGADSAGLLGYEFAKRAVLTIDYAKHTMTFTKPDKFQPPKDAPAIPFTFDGHIPMLEGSLDGMAGQFELDTGARGALTVMHPFAQANGMVDKYHATRSATVGYGVGGPSRALLGRAGKLVLGPVTIEAPVTEFVTDTGGAAAAARTAGNIGGDLLKRFTVTLDYGHQTLWLQPNALAQQKEVFDRSGLWISRAEDGGIAVADVTTDSPAAASGLATGDEITSVNGKPAKDVALYALREQFKGATGTRFTLAVKGSDGKPRKVTLVLADQV